MIIQITSLYNIITGLLVFEFTNITARLAAEVERVIVARENKIESLRYKRD